MKKFTETYSVVKHLPPGSTAETPWGERFIKKNRHIWDTRTTTCDNLTVAAYLHGYPCKFETVFER